MAEKIENIRLEDYEDSTDNATAGISDRILALSDDLSEEIILENIADHIDGKIPYAERENYVTLYKNKLSKVREEDDSSDLKLAIINSVYRVIDVVLGGLEKVYGVTIGKDPEDALNIYDYLDDIETLYEFFFVRNYQNIFDIVYKTLNRRKAYFVDIYKEVYNDTEDSDLFVGFSKKKFKHFSDAIITNYTTDIIFDIKSMYESSGLQLFRDIVNLDRYESFNDRMYEMLINYGERFVCESDKQAAVNYFNMILGDKELLIKLKNDITMKYLETVEVDENYGNEAELV